jgi:hypothetical protein
MWTFPATTTASHSRERAARSTAGGGDAVDPALVLDHARIRLLAKRPLESGLRDIQAIDLATLALVDLDHAQLLARDRGEAGRAAAVDRTQQRQHVGIRPDSHLGDEGQCEADLVELVAREPGEERPAAARRPGIEDPLERGLDPQERGPDRDAVGGIAAEAPELDPHLLVPAWMRGRRLLGSGVDVEREHTGRIVHPRDLSQRLRPDCHTFTLARGPRARIGGTTNRRYGLPEGPDDCPHGAAGCTPCHSMPPHIGHHGSVRYTETWYPQAVHRKSPRTGPPAIATTSAAGSAVLCRSGSA